MLVRIIKNWTTPNLMRQTPGTLGRWGDICFTFDEVEECDAVVVLNHVTAPARFHCSPDNVWALMQEPYIGGVFDWIMEGHKQYGRVFTHHPPSGSKREKYIRCQPAVPWHVNRSYDQLKLLNVTGKRKDLSWITSNLNVFPGHRVRMDFLEFLKIRNLRMDLYGKGINFIEDKWDGLAPYRYSLAIENSSGPDYWTEKIADCFLTWTVPIYYGCTNLEEYFPTASFIRIDINEPERAYDTIMSTMTDDDWQARLPALEEARRLVLDRYQFFPQLKELIDQYYRQAPAKEIELQPYSRKLNWQQNIRRHFSRLYNRLVV